MGLFLDMLRNSLKVASFFEANLAPVSSCLALDRVGHSCAATPLCCILISFLRTFATRRVDGLMLRGLTDEFCPCASQPVCPVNQRTFQQIPHEMFATTTSLVQKRTVSNLGHVSHIDLARTVRTMPLGTPLAIDHARIVKSSTWELV